MLHNYRDASDWFSNPPHPHNCPQAKDKSSYWAYHLDVLTLCGMIYRKAASITVSLTPCIDKMLKIQNCQDGTVHSLWLKQPSAHSPRHTQKRLQCQKQWLDPSVPKSRRPEAVCLTQKGGPTTSTPFSPTSMGNSACFLLAGSLEAATVMGQAISHTAASRQEWRFNNHSAYAVLFPAMVYS